MWDYRIMKRTLEDGSESLAVYEVFFNEDGTVKDWTECEVAPIARSDECDDLKSYLRLEIESHLEALSKPILDYATGKEIKN